jgi:hypothetical protein
MKFMAVIDDSFLSNFRVDMSRIGVKPLVLVVKDERGYERGIELKPIGREMIVTPDGESMYITQKHIDAMIDMERKEIFNDAVEKMMEDLM